MFHVQHDGPGCLAKGLIQTTYKGTLLNLKAQLPEPHLGFCAREYDW